MNPGKGNMATRRQETVYVRTPMQVTFVIERVPGTRWFHGQLQEYPGVLTQGRTEQSVRKRLVTHLREVMRDFPEELEGYR